MHRVLKIRIGRLVYTVTWIYSLHPFSRQRITIRVLIIDHVSIEEFAKFEALTIVFPFQLDSNVQANNAVL